jgi:hypothetical protein
LLRIDPALLIALLGLIGAIFVGLLGLLGVIVGGLITGGVNYFLEARRASRDEAKERRKRLTDLKQAARLIAEDFNWALASVKLAIEKKRWPDPRHDSIRLQSWSEYRSVLAAETTWD